MSVAAKLQPKAAPKLSRKELKDVETKRRQDALVTQYMPYASSIANRVFQTLSSAVDYDDVLCNARLGLLEAAQRFDGEQQVEFRTFAYYRIKGAIYDGLRRTGWLPRSLYSKLKFEEAANEYMQYRARTGLQDEEREHELVDTVNSLASIYVISLDEHEDIDIEDVDAPDVEGRAEFHQIRTHMREAINTLPPKEKQLIMMYYFQNRTLEEVGERLDLSKSWTCRLHARALEMLLKKIRGLTSDGGEGETK